MTALEIMVNTIFKSLNLDPEQVKGQIAQLMQIIVEDHHRMVRIESKLDLLIGERINNGPERKPVVTIGPGPDDAGGQRHGDEQPATVAAGTDRGVGDARLGIGGGGEIPQHVGKFGGVVRNGNGAHS